MVVPAVAVAGDFPPGFVPVYKAHRSSPFSSFPLCPAPVNAKLVAGWLVSLFPLHHCCGPHLPTPHRHPRGRKSVENVGREKKRFHPTAEAFRAQHKRFPIGDNNLHFAFTVSGLFFVSLSLSAELSFFFGAVPWKSVEKWKLSRYFFSGIPCCPPVGPTVMCFFVDVVSPWYSGGRYRHEIQDCSICTDCGMFYFVFLRKNKFQNLKH